MGQADPQRARKFLFQQDFGAPGGETSPREQAAIAEAETRAREEGFASGRAAALAEQDADLARTLSRVAEAAENLLARADEEREVFEREALAFAEALARKLAGDALERYPMDAIAEVARASFEHLRGVPHLVVRVNEALVEKTDALMKKMARERGFEGRLVIMGEPDVASGDARFEWADGGVARDGARIGEEVASRILAG
ncbi:MAG: flagellar assembly protein FliH [Salinarimonadaceae bacterium]|nr:MAG: flagellar assembly protein FliH [Salinarimonadaceae bacterium]